MTAISSLMAPPAWVSSASAVVRGPSGRPWNVNLTVLSLQCSSRELSGRRVDGRGSGAARSRRSQAVRAGWRRLDPVQPRRVLPQDLPSHLLGDVPEVGLDGRV